MKTIKSMKAGLYFVHEHYMDYEIVENNEKKPLDHMILLREALVNEYADLISREYESPEARLLEVGPLEARHVYDVDAFDVTNKDAGESMDARDLLGTFPEGVYVYYNGSQFSRARDNEVIGRNASELIRVLDGIPKGSKPEGASDDEGSSITDVHSFHVNVGHGNCSIVVFNNGNKREAWMVDCSVREINWLRVYSLNLSQCLADIKREFGITEISKLFVTHLHYDHLNGIKYMIDNGYVTSDTEVWMNLKYPCQMATYRVILQELKRLKVKFVDPIVGNSTSEIKILYPDQSFDASHPAPDNKINNSSVLYQFCLGGKKMLFTGDIETAGWDKVNTCAPYLKYTNYYCISHHGSITGHDRTICYAGFSGMQSVKDCASKSVCQILMGRNGAFKGIFSSKVLSDFPNALITQNATNYIRIDWDTDLTTFI
ncbi:MAG: hypothetical protein K6F51_15020 [Acetatifactor sp.]|nr:hypothetical protein [Acetatifactor sp.]